ncbi:MAG TPA: tetratricopeptide repeat protein [Acidobacteriota bacterium]|nr:tetratricopeptide repeat protein [Acidobacteriota bacterium]
MSRTALKFFWIVLCLFGMSTMAQAQDFEVLRYDVTASLQPVANAVDVKATLSLVNQTTQGQSATDLILRLNKDAKVTALLLNGATTEFTQKEDPRLTGVSIVSAQLVKSVPPAGKLEAVLQYTLTVKESNQYSAITPGDCLLLPESYWIPVVHTPFTSHGADTAPYTLTVTLAGDGDILSEGERKGDGKTVMFTQTLNSQPWLMVGAPGKLVTRSITPAGAAPITLTTISQVGSAGTEGQVQRILDEMEKIVGFYVQTLGPSPTNQFVVASNFREVTYISPGTILVGNAVFRRDRVEAETIEYLSRAVARTWIGGKLRVRGRGLGIVQDALPSFLSGLYFESRFGADAGQQFWARRVRSYAPLALARTDAMLMAQVPLDSDYFTSILNKGALVFRLIDWQFGKNTVVTAVKTILTGTTMDPLTVEGLRSTLIGPDKNANQPLQRFLKQWWDEIVEPDLIIGLPKKNETGTAWTCVLRNLGTGDVTVPVVAITGKGETLTTKAAIPSKGLGSVEFQTAEEVVRVEIDPDKLYPQTKFELDPNSSQFDNDSRPPRQYSFSLFLEANQLFEQKEFQKAEAKLLQTVAQEPGYASAQMLLARVELALGKSEATQSALQKALDVKPTPLYVTGWSAIVEGELALTRKDFKAAVEAYRRADGANAELACTLAAHKGLIESETQLQQISMPDESVKAYFSQLEKAVQSKTASVIEALVIKAELPKFVKGLALTKPDVWKTEVIRASQLDTQHVAVDVNLEALTTDLITGEKKDQKGSAVFILRKTQSGWVLARIDLFTVK